MSRIKTGLNLTQLITLNSVPMNFMDFVFEIDVLSSPVKSNAQHAILSEGRHEELNVFCSLPVLGQRTLQQRYRAHPDNIWGYVTEKCTCYKDPLNQIRRM